MMVENVLVTCHGLLKFGILVCGVPVFVIAFGTIELLIVETVVSMACKLN